MARHEHTHTNTRKQQYTIWQWNCRGYRRKRGNLEQFIRSRETKPDVILLQETNHAAKLAGYKAINAATADNRLREKRATRRSARSGTPGAAAGRRGRGDSLSSSARPRSLPSPPPPVAAVLVRRNITVAQRELECVRIPHVFVELIPKRGRGLFVLNVYSKPTLQHRFGELLRRASTAANGAPLLVAGDFNAPHGAWGYTRETLKGKHLWEDSQDQRLELIANPADPTRRGNSVSADTLPDLAFVSNVTAVSWQNTQEDLGSDHSLIEITVDTGPSVRGTYSEGTGRRLKLVQWDAFRKKRAEGGRGDEPITDIDEWTATLNRDVDAVTCHIPPEAKLEVIDSRLLHMWEAKQALLKRWKRQRHNRALRKRIAQLDREIEEHAFQVCRAQWEDLCNGLERQMRGASAWRLFRHLLDPEDTRAAQSHKTRRLVTDHKGDDLLGAIRDRYFKSAESVQHPDYNGVANEQLDAEFSEAEIRNVLFELNTRSAPGLDRVSNKALRNLDDESISRFVSYINECWQRGSLPEAWKRARVIMIPKPGKQVALDNLRPISLTSCVGKVLEHAVLNRVTDFLEDRDVFPHTMLGFRRNLSAQDALLQLKHHIVDDTTSSTKAILGLDIKKAFDSVKHEAILNRVQTLGLGQKTYNYIRDFLAGRRVCVVVGDVELQEFEMGSRGTPQGSVISPLLFNLVLLGLPEKLLGIHGLCHSIYADDITLWVPGGGCDGHVERTLQAGVDEVQEYLRGTGLECSATKSELLIYKPTSRGRKTPRDEERECYKISVLLADGTPIPHVDKIRILGLHLQANGHNGETVRRLRRSVDDTIRLLRRITNRRNGMREHCAIRLVQAYAISRITYVAPYLKWLGSEKNKIECMIRKAFKRAIGVPLNASTEKFLELGLHNSLDELIEAHVVSQNERLSGSKTGRHILASLGIRYHTQQGEKADVPASVRDRLIVPPLPKNMHPTHHVGRRNQRARDLQKKYGTSDEVVYVDAARYGDGRDAHAAAVVDRTGKCLTSATVTTGHTEAAEEAAIALAIATAPNATIVISDSQAAIRGFARGRVSREAARILKMCGDGDSASRLPPQNSTVFLLWTPAHTEVPLAGNEAAHAAARGLTRRAVAHSVATASAPENGASDLPDRDTSTDTQQQHGPQWSWGDRLITFRDITQHYRLERRKFPPPHDKLNRHDAVSYRLLQTHSYPSPVVLRHCYPHLYTTDLCKTCGHRATLRHMLWECAGNNSRETPAVRDAPMAAANTRQQEASSSLVPAAVPAAGAAGDLLRRRRRRWEAALRSSELNDQLWAVRQAEDAARVQGLSAAI